MNSLIFARLSNPLKKCPKCRSEDDSEIGLANEIVSYRCKCGFTIDLDPKNGSTRSAIQRQIKRVLESEGVQ